MPDIACADTALETWRDEISNVRKLSENNAPLAREQARHLQKNMPIEATHVDKAQVLNLLARTEIYTAQAEASASHSQQALEIAKRNGDRIGQAEAYLNISLNSVNQANIDSLIDVAPRAMEVLHGVDRPDLLGEAMLRAAMMYRRVGQLDESVTLCMQAMDIAKRSNNPMALLYAAQCLGVSYDQSERYADARVYFTQMRDLAKTVQAKQLEADAIGGIAASAGNMGDWRMALSLQREAIALYREAGVPFNIAHGLYQLASNLRQHDLLAESLKPFGEVLAIYEQHPNKIGMWWTLNARSKTYQALGRLAPARVDAERAYVLAKDIGLLLYQSESAKRMAAVNAAMGYHKQAYQFSTEAEDLADKLSREKTSARMVELAQRYQNESKQKQIDELNLREQQRGLERNWLLTVLGGSFILLVGSAYFLLRLRRSQQLLVVTNVQLRQSQDEVNALNAGLEHRVQAQTAELRQQTRYLRTLIDTLPVSIWLKDTGGRYLAVNAGTVANSSPARKDYAPEQMIGKTDDELWPDDVRQSFSVRDVEVMQTRQHKTYEIAIPGPDGSVAWREVDKAPVIDEDGSVLGIVGFARDISERKRYEQALLERAELERRQSQFFAMISGIFATVLKRADGSYSIPFISDGVRDLYGLEPDAVMRDIMVFAALAHPDDVEMTFLKADASARDLIPYRVEYRINHPRKGVRWIECRSTPQRMPDGGTRWDGFYFDITDRKEMESSLHNSQYLLTEAQRIAHIGSWEMNLVDNILSWSDEIYRIFEIDPQQFGATYEAFMNTVHPDDRELLDRAYKISLEKRERFELEHRLLLPDGRIKYVFECCESYYDDNGKPLRSLGTVQDITERKEMGLALQAREREFHSLADNIPDNIARWDIAGRYLYINPVHERTLGVSASEVIGKSHLDHHEQVYAAIAQVVATGLSTIVLQPVLVGGEMQTHEVSLAPEFDSEGRVVSVLGVGRDMTDLYRLQDELKASEQELRALAESSPGMMGAFYARPDGSICMPYVSPNIEELFGLRPQDVAVDAAPLLALNHPDDAQRVKDTIAESARTMTVWHQEYRMMHPTKGLRWMESNTQPQAHPDGGVIWYGHVHDITERKRIEQALIESEARYRDNSNLLQGMMESMTEVSFFALDRQYHYLAFNNTHRGNAKSRWGTEIELGSNWLDGVHTANTEEFRDFCRRGFDQVLAGESFSIGSVEKYSGADGQIDEQYFDNFGSPIYTEKGEVVGLTVFSINITERKKTEAEKRRLTEMMEQSVDFVGMADMQGRLFYHNPSALRMVGLPEDADVSGMHIADMHPAWVTKLILETAIPETLKCGVWRGETEVLHQDGHVIPVFQTLMLHRDAEGKPEYTSTIIQDISERKQMEESLRLKEEKLSNLFALSPLGIALTDTNGKYIEFNEAFCKICGYPADELLTLDYWTLTPEIYQASEAEQLESLSKTGRYGPYEKEYRQKNGNLVPIQLIGVLVKGSDGKEYVWSIVEDITERKRMEADLHASHNFLDSVIDSVSDPIFVKDRQHRWTLLNDAFCNFIGHSRETLLGKSDYDFFPEDQADEFWAKDEFVFNAGEVNLNEERFTTARGEEHYIQTKKTPFVSGDGQPMLVGVIRDITDYKRYEEAREAALAEAMRLAKTRSEFLAHMSHELRTPLNGILGYTQILQRDPTLSARNADSLNVIRHSGEHLLSLVEDILDLARIEVGRFKLDLGDISLATFLRVVVDIVSIRATQKGLEFITDVATDLPAGVRGDDKRLRQVLLNLLSNAVKFTEHGKVVLHVSRVSPSRIAFAIDDTGIGIVANELETIFLPFEQSGDVQQRFGGAGLGLSISRQLVRLMGGDITVESSIGKGSTFRFELELPVVEIDLAGLLPLPAPNEQAEAASGDETSALLIMPSIEEMKHLHRLAQLGNMRDIVQYAEHISTTDARYQPFAERLRRMAEGFQSKAILAFVERYLHDAKN